MLNIKKHYNSSMTLRGYVTDRHVSLDGLPALLGVTLETISVYSNFTVR